MQMAEGGHHARAEPAPRRSPVVAAPPVQPGDRCQGTLVDQVLERPLRPGEVSLDELERAFRETETEVAPRRSRRCASRAAPQRRRSRKPSSRSQGQAAPKPPLEADVQEADKIANQSIRVNVDTLEHLMTMVSELVLTRNQLLEISRRNEDTEFKVPLQRLSNVTAELQEGVMKTRMQPIGNAWQKLPRIVRDLSGELGKQIELEMHGADTELDRQVLDLIKDPLTHMVRNSADHGLETPAERAGQPASREQGTIRLSAYHEGGHIIICIADNGRGLNTERIKAKAIAERSRHRGRTREDDRSPDPQVHLRAGLLDRGCRHLGLRPRRRHGRGAHQYRPDRRHHRHQVGGRRGLHRHHQDPADAGDRLGADRGSRRRPLRDPAACRWSNWCAPAPIPNTASSASRTRAVLRLRNKLLPLMHLKKLLKIDDGSSSDPENGFIVVTQVGSQTFGIVVDGVFHTEEIVVKPMSTKLRHIDMFSGNTILGDGAVIMIIDPNGIAKALGASGSSAHETGRRGRRRACDQRRAADLAAGVPRRIAASPRRCRSASSPGWRRSPPTRSSSPTAATWCSTASS